MTILRQSPAVCVQSSANKPIDSFKAPQKLRMGPPGVPAGRQSSYVYVDGSPILHPIIGMGMTGLILLIDELRVLKVPKLYNLDGYEGQKLDYARLGNEDNYETFQNEKAIYDRLEHHEGIIHCFKASDQALELAYAREGNLEMYIDKQGEPQMSTKVNWILSLIDTLSYIHSMRILVDEIALRNILVLDKDLKLSDFGQSVLLPMMADMTTTDDGAGLTVKVEILHLGWVFYAIAAWQNRRYYYFESETPFWPKPEELPRVDDLFCGIVIKNCWAGEYESVKALQKEAIALFVDLSLA